MGVALQGRHPVLRVLAVPPTRPECIARPHRHLPEGRRLGPTLRGERIAPRPRESSVLESLPAARRGSPEESRPTRDHGGGQGFAPVASRIPTPGTGFTSVVPQTQSNSARFVALRATVPTGGRRSLASAPLALFDARRDGSHPAVWRFPCRPPTAGCADRRSAFPGQRVIRLVSGPDLSESGGGGGNRTRVRKPSATTSTCISGLWPGTRARRRLSLFRSRAASTRRNRGSVPIPGAHRRLGKTAGKARLGRRPFPPGRRGQEGRGYLSSQCQFSVGFCFVSTVYERWTPDMQSLLHVPSSNPVRPLLARFGRHSRG